MLKLDGQIKRFSASQKLGQDGGIIQEVQFVVVAKMPEKDIAELAKLQLNGLVVLQLDQKRLGMMPLFNGKGEGNAEVSDQAG